MKHGDTAHIPGQGPACMICKDCTHFDLTASKCRKAAEMRRTSLLALKKLNPHTMACKYFVERRA